MSQQTHTSDPRILDRRTLENNHRRLAAALRQGMRVLDVGCGTGAITAGTARSVGPEGYVLGIDRDQALLEQARSRFANVPNLEFKEQDVLTLSLNRGFDIVTAARALQWIERPEPALSRMKAAAKSGGLVIALDYNHTQNSWVPKPPREFLAFYQAFLEWRSANQWENDIGDRLAELFERAGLSGISVHVEDEVAKRGEPGFPEVAELWAHVIQTIGPKITAAGFLTEPERLKARAIYPAWCRDKLMCQTLVLRVAGGRVPHQQ